MRNLAAKQFTSQAHAQPKVLSYVYLNRLRQFSKLKSRSEKFSIKHRQVSDAGLNDVKKDSWSAVPPAVWHYCSMKYYGSRAFYVNGRIAELVPKLANEEKLSSFVEKQVDTEKLGFFQKERRSMKSLLIRSLAGAGATLAAAFVMSELSYIFNTFVSEFREPVAAAITIGIAIMSFALGVVAQFKVDWARDMLEIGGKKAKKLASDVKKLAA